MAERSPLPKPASSSRSTPDCPAIARSSSAGRSRPGRPGSRRAACRSRPGPGVPRRARRSRQRLVSQVPTPARAGRRSSRACPSPDCGFAGAVRARSSNNARRSGKAISPDSGVRQQVAVLERARPDSAVFDDGSGSPSTASCTRLSEPPWLTTSTRPSGWRPAISRRARMTRSEWRSYVSPSHGRPSICAFVSPCHEPTSISRSPGSRPTGEAETRADDLGGLRSPA